jgi:tRNA U54 and U55 pseudouridine synthase Pus10
MLGDGRPFVMEVIAPRLPDPSSEQLRAAEEALARAEQ